MFRRNQDHLQPALISNIEELPETLRIRLEQSWAGVFYRELFSRIDESVLAVLYADKPSRPNIPVNVLLGLEVLKSGFGWSDEELYDQYLYDVQVRYALGYHSLGEGIFTLRTLYNFRRALSEYNQAHGVNLVSLAFTDVTDQQIESLAVRTRQQRMDSTQIASNILNASRLHLLVDAVQRLWRHLSEEDKRRYGQFCTRYVEQDADHYVFSVKGKEAVQTELQTVGGVLQELLAGMKDSHENEPLYVVVNRLFNENFHINNEEVEPKENSEIDAGSLQSLDDQEATFRRKGKRKYKGYVVNVTETCDPENEVQLITSVQVDSNSADDAALLVEAVPDLVERTDIETLYTDGAYGSPAADEALNAHHITQIQTGIRGKTPAPDKLNLSDFTIEQDQDGHPTYITCPLGQRVAIEAGRTTGFIARFSAQQCESCPLHREGRCRAKPGKRDSRYRLSFTLQEVYSAKRRQRHKAFMNTPGNPRAAVEATIGSLKSRFSNGKVSVRGLFRTTYVMIAAAAMCNIRKIHRYIQAKLPPQRRTPSVVGARTFGTDK